MRWLACVVACTGCEALFGIAAVHVDDATTPPSDVMPPDAPPDAPIMTYCTMLTPPPLFCADFDSPATSRFATTNVATGAMFDTGVVNTPAPTTPPNVLHAMASGVETAFGVQPLPNRPLTIAFDVHACGSRETIATVAWGSGETVTFSYTASNTFSMSASGMSCLTSGGGAAAPKPNVLSHVVISITATSIDVAVDAASVNIASNCAFTTGPTLSIGAMASASSACTLVDTIVVTAQ